MSDDASISDLDREELVHRLQEQFKSKMDTDLDKVVEDFLEKMGQKKSPANKYRFRKYLNKTVLGLNLDMKIRK